VATKAAPRIGRSLPPFDEPGQRLNAPCSQTTRKPDHACAVEKASARHQTLNVLNDTRIAWRQLWCHKHGEGAWPTL